METDKGRVVSSTEEFKDYTSFLALDASFNELTAHRRWGKDSEGRSTLYYKSRNKGSGLFGGLSFEFTYESDVAGALSKKSVLNLEVGTAFIPFLEDSVYIKVSQYLVTEYIKENALYTPGDVDSHLCFGYSLRRDRLEKFFGSDLVVPATKGNIDPVICAMTVEMASLYLPASSAKVHRTSY